MSDSSRSKRRLSLNFSTSGGLHCGPLLSVEAQSFHKCSPASSPSTNSLPRLCSLLGSSPQMQVPELSYHGKKQRLHIRDLVPSSPPKANIYQCFTKGCCICNKFISYFHNRFLCGPRLEKVRLPGKATIKNAQERCPFHSGRSLQWLSWV